MKKPSSKSTAKTWLLPLIAVGLVISYLVAVISIISSNLVPDKYLVAGIALSSIVVIGLVYGLLKPRLKTTFRIIVVITSIVAIIASLYAYSLSSATNRFLSDIQSDKFTTIEYNLIAKKDRNISLRSATLKTGLLTSDVNNNLVKFAVNQRANATYKNFPNPIRLTLALDDETADIAALQSSYVNLLEDVNPELYETYEILATFTIKVPNEQNTADSDVGKPFAVYISGIDTYGDITSVARSDVNILAVINPKSRQVLLVNTPRDYYVTLAGTDGANDKLTHAGIYGIDTSRQTLENLYDTEIDYYLRVNFSSLTKLVDTLGGVTVDSEYAFTAEDYSFQKGSNTLNGAEALAFARERKSFQEGDRVRGENQQRVISGIIQKLSDPRVLTDYREILDALEGTSQTNMSSKSITSLIKSQLSDLGQWSTSSISVDGSDAYATTYSTGSQELYVMQPNQSSVRSAQQRIDDFLAD